MTYTDKPIMYDNKITLEEAVKRGIKLEPHILFCALSSNMSYAEYERRGK